MDSQHRGISPLNPLLESTDANVELMSAATPAKDNHSSTQRSSQERTLNLHCSLKEARKIDEQQATGELKDHPKKSVFRLWWMELLSISFSLICLTTNVAVLVALDKRQYESWKVASVNLTPNTIVSVIATFTKASLLLVVAEVIAQLKWLYFRARTQTVSHLQVFDDASRGPLGKPIEIPKNALNDPPRWNETLTKEDIGSLLLLWKINLHSTLASLAAIVIILALAIEPFTQQIIRYPTRESMALNTSASISATQVFRPMGFNFDFNKQELLSAVEQQELSIAVDSGISKSAASAAYTCPSGSCTWPPFSSLALCNYCKDINSHVHVNCSSNATSGSSSFCVYSIGAEFIDAYYPDQMLAWNWWNKTNENTYKPITVMNISKATAWFPGDAEPYPSSTYIHFVRFNDSYHSTSPHAPHDIMPTFMQCNFKWCAQYHGSTRYENGTLFDTPEFSVPMIGSQYPYPPDNTDAWSTNTSTLTASQARKFNKTITRYIIDNDSADEFFSLMGSMLQNIVFNPPTDVQGNAKDLKFLPSQYVPEYDAFKDKEMNTARSYSLYYANNGDLYKSMDNIALSVTNSMRSSLNSNNVTGSAMYTVVYIEVVWPWLIYSAVLLVASAILLGLTISLSHGKDKMVWKSSSLALLFHGMPDGYRYGALTDAQSMEKIANDIWARLAEDEKGNLRLKVL